MVLTRRGSVASAARPRGQPAGARSETRGASGTWRSAGDQSPPVAEKHDTSSSRSPASSPSRSGRARRGREGSVPSKRARRGSGCAAEREGGATGARTKGRGSGGAWEASGGERVPDALVDRAMADDEGGEVDGSRAREEGQGTNDVGERDDEGGDGGYDVSQLLATVPVSPASGSPASVRDGDARRAAGEGETERASRPGPLHEASASGNGGESSRSASQADMAVRRRLLALTQEISALKAAVRLCSELPCRGGVGGDDDAHEREGPEEEGDERGGGGLRGGGLGGGGLGGLAGRGMAMGMGMGLGPVPPVRPALDVFPSPLLSLPPANQNPPLCSLADSTAGEDKRKTMREEGEGETGGGRRGGGPSGDRADPDLRSPAQAPDSGAPSPSALATPSTAAPSPDPLSLPSPGASGLVGCPVPAPLFSFRMVLCSLPPAVEIQARRALASLLASRPGAPPPLFSVSLHRRVTPCTTHVIVPTCSSTGRVASRTTRYLAALAAGCWVLSPAWLLESASGGAWRDEQSYECRGDAVCEGGPRTARMRRQSQRYGLFHGTAFLLRSCGRLPRGEVARILTLAGAEVRIEDRNGKHKAMTRTKDDGTGDAGQGHEKTPTERMRADPSSPRAPSGQPPPPLSSSPPSLACSVMPPAPVETLGSLSQPLSTLSIPEGATQEERANERNGWNAGDGAERTAGSAPGADGDAEEPPTSVPHFSPDAARVQIVVADEFPTTYVPGSNSVSIEGVFADLAKQRAPWVDERQGMP